MIVPSGAKIPLLDQRKKRGFCKYHSFLGHKTSQCFIFRDLIQNAIKEWRLKFGEKTKGQMKVDIDPLHIAKINYVEPAYIHMLEVDGFDINQHPEDKITEDFVSNIETKEATEGFANTLNTVTEDFVASIKVQKTIEGLANQISKARLLMILPQIPEC